MKNYYNSILFYILFKLFLYKIIQNVDIYPCINVFCNKFISLENTFLN